MNICTYEYEDVPQPPVAPKPSPSQKAATQTPLSEKSDATHQIFGNGNVDGTIILL